MDQQSVQLPHDVHDYPIDIDQIIENAAKETGYKPDELMDLLPRIEWEKNPIESVKYILGDICKFDEVAYAEQYPDIPKDSSISPLDHYIMYGFKENRQFYFVRDKLGIELSPRNTSQGMFEILKQYDVISFDIFDTVLFRKVEFPDKIFDIMSLEMGWPDFSDARKFAETDAREKSEQTYGHREIVLDDIYESLYTKFNIEPHWKLREIELEEKSSLRNDFIFKIYVKLLEAGKEIIFVSDMYLPLNVIKNLLKINGYNPYAKIYLSNQYKLRKGDGTLQQVVRNDFLDKKLIHVGDNRESDKRKFEENGIPAIWNADSRLKKREAFLNTLLGNIYRAVINNNLNNGLWNHYLHYTHGFRVGGFLVAGYCQFVNRIAKATGTQLILFCSRDCYILHKVYNNFYKKLENRYIEISRFAIMNIASERYAYDLMNRFIFRYWDETNGAITIAQLLNDTGYDYLVPYLDDFDISRFKFCSNLSKAIFRDFFLSQINHIKEHEQESLEVAKDYFCQMVKDISKILIVDIGWSGTCINALKYFIHTNISRDIEVYGALMCASDTQKMANQILHKEICVYINSPVQNADLHSMMTGNKQDKKGTDRLHLPLEYLFTAPYPSLIGYARESEGKMLFRRDNNFPNNKNEINLIQRGVFDFNQIFSTYLHDMNIENVAIPPYSAFIALKQAIQNKQYIFDVYRNFLYDALTLPGSQREYRTLYASLFPEFTLSNMTEIVHNANTILFTSPELIYAGAPQSLLRISKVAIQLGYYPIVWSKRDGPFRVEFEKYDIPVSIVPESQIETKENIKIIKSCRFAFCNTVVTDVYVRVLSKYIGTIWFIREASNMESFLRNDEKRRNLLQTYDNIFCVSEYAAKALASYTKKPIHILHNCIEDESDLAVDYLPGTGEKVKFVQFGTMEYRKGYDILIAAYKSLPVEYQKRCEFYFAGGFINSGTSYCDYIFSEMKNIPSFHYLGVVAGSANKMSTLSKMDVVVVASRDESCSLVALEGSMLSKPLIVTENVGAKYMVDRDNGIIVPSNNVMAMCRAIMSMIDRKDELSKMGKASRRNYEERANMKHHAEALKNLFDAMESADKKQLDLPLMNDFVAPQIVISLTSHPPRMNTLAICLQSLVDQDYKEARIVLYLAKSQFPNGDNDLPQEVLNIQKSCDRLEIRWVDVDLKPHKKYFFACQEYANQPIITVDDDVLYAPCMVSELIRSYKKFPHCISCHRANMIMMRSDKSFRSYKQWQMEYTMLVDTPSYRLIPTGVGGVLYPPHSLPKRAFDVKKIQELCLYTDDLWLKMMCLVNNIPAVVVRNYCLPKLIPETQDSAIWHQNVIRNENDIALNNITKYVQENIPEWSTIRDTLYCDVK